MKYIATNLIITICLVIYYISVAKYNPIALIAITIVTHGVVIISVVMLAFKDPGILKKKYQNYEYKDLQQIPSAQSHNLLSKFDQVSYLMPLKSHCMKLKFCSSCCVFRPPRTTHCSHCNVCV